MGVTLAGLEASGLVQRRPDPADGRRVILSVTVSGRKVLRNRRTAKAAKLTKALSSEFTRMELEHLKAAVPLIERLAEAI
jgi:DNA-binding MarR family transcriptional regulator